MCFFRSAPSFRTIIASPHIQNARKKILNHDFVRLIITGELCRNDYKYYMKEDSAYLANLRITLLNSAGQLYAQGDYKASKLLTYRAGRLETGLREKGYTLGHSGEIFFNGCLLQKNPVTHAYTNHIQSAAKRSLIEGICALYPCYDTYRHIGKSTSSHFLHPHHPYKSWLEDNVGSFITQVEQIEDIATRTLKNEPHYHSAEKREILHTILLKSYEFEYNLFDEASRACSTTKELTTPSR